jgi:hypothetical protein
MTEEQHELEVQALDKTLKRIDLIAYEMRDDRNDGWVKEFYRQSLINIRDHINKALER